MQFIITINPQAQGAPSVTVQVQADDIPQALEAAKVPAVADATRAAGVLASVLPKPPAASAAAPAAPQEA